jgi:hypothetical protein
VKKAALALLALATGVGAYLRFHELGLPSYWLDEVLGQILTTKVLEQPWWHWLTGFEAEHGPLYYATQLATRLAGSSEFAGRLAAALFGVATIPLVWLAARRGVESSSRRLDDSSTPDTGRLARSLGAFAAAALLAISPFHVYYSREARPYALLMFLTAALLLLLLRGASLASLSLVLVAMLYTSATAAPAVAAAGIAALFSRKRSAAIPAFVMAGAFLLLYRQTPGETPGVPFPEWSGELFMKILRSLTVSGLGAEGNGRTLFALCVFALIGAVALFRRDRRAAMVIITMTLLPVGIAVAVLKVTGHWFALRYLGPGLIGFVVLAGAGIAAVATLVARSRGWAPAIALLIVAVIGAQTWNNARREPLQKLDWRAITSKIVRYARPGDLVIAAEPWTGIMSDYYLARQPNQVVDIQTSLVPIAEQLRASYPATFIISTHAPGDDPMRPWTCSHPLILSSAIDNFRMHYAGDFLRERAQAAELRAVAAGLEDGVLYGSGWSGVEGSGEDTFRWAVGREATMIVPRWKAHHSVRLRMSPLVDPSLPQQGVRISLNGKFLREVMLDAGPSEHTIDVPDGLNTLTFAFRRATRPVDVDPRNGDTRALAVAFREISAPFKAARPVQIRIASPPFLDENTSWRGTRTRITPDELRREAVIPLLGRLGFDPETTWPRLQSGELHLENLEKSLAYGSDCMN